MKLMVRPEMVILPSGPLRALIPIDSMSENELRELPRAAYAVSPKQARSPGYHRLSHALGKLLVENVPTFERLDAHRALKRLQYEADIECEHIVALDDEGREQDIRYPRSIAFESMDQREFEGMMRAICEYVAFTYWDGIEVDEVIDMIDEIAA